MVPYRKTLEGKEADPWHRRSQPFRLEISLTCWRLTKYHHLVMTTNTPTNIRVGSVTGCTPYELVYDRLTPNPIYMGFLERENEVMSWSIIIRRLQRDRQQLIQDIYAQTLNSRRCRFRNMLMNAMRGRVISKPVKTSIQASWMDNILTFRSRWEVTSKRNFFMRCNRAIPM